MNSTSSSLEIVCPAGTPAALRAAVDAGAHAVYCGFRDATNARNFPGLNFNVAELEDGIRYAHLKGVKVFVALNTFPQAGNVKLWKNAADQAMAAGVDALILADVGLMAYCAGTYPEARLHLSVQAAAANEFAIQYYHERFGIKRAVLPRVLTIQDIIRINQNIPCETEVFVFGGLCVMAEGRCSLSSYATGQSPNINGVCSPPGSVKYQQRNSELVSRLGNFTINRFGKDEPAGYPTLCKGRFASANEVGYIFEDPISLNAADILPSLKNAGIAAIKIEGRQRSRSYISTVVRSFREAVDALEKGNTAPLGKLKTLTEGQQETCGAYQKSWR